MKYFKEIKNDKKNHEHLLKGKNMNEFIEKNEKFLRLVCNIARFLGLFLIGSLVLVLIPIILLDNKGISHFLNFPSTFLGLIFSGIMLLGIEQLIRCLIDLNFKPNWILRFSDKVIYTYTAFLFVNGAYTIYVFGHNIRFVLPFTIFTSIKILIWIGIALFLKRIVPIIQESKTLV